MKNTAEGMEEKESMLDIVLASGSPRRRELLTQIGLEFRVVVSDVDETVEPLAPSQVAVELSKRKAEAVWRLLEEEPGSRLLIGADTIVVCDGSILGKPADSTEAAEMLKRLQGREHEVYTGVTLLHREAQETVQCKSFHEVTKVHFYPMSPDEVEGYTATADPLDKAGAYGIQGICARYISGVEGDYNNVVGLPVGRLYQEAKEWLDK